MMLAIHKVFQLMRDGRERTSADVARAAKIGDSTADHELRELQRMGLLTVDRLEGINVWRKA